MPTPFPVPLPVQFGPHEADWWMVALTALGILVTGLIALLTLRANRVADATREVADRMQINATEANVAAMNAAQAASSQQVQVLTSLITRLEGLQLSSGTDQQPQTPETDVRWSIARDGKNRWTVRNIGTATAYGVTVDGLTSQDKADLYVPQDDPIDAPPYTAIPFVISRTLSSPPATVIQVEWTDDLGTERSTRMVVV